MIDLIMPNVNTDELKNEGTAAHRNHMRRTDNPYLLRARLWDEGWVRRQKVELTADGKHAEATRLSTFWKWLKEL
jgi:hypothetical protein